MNKKFRVDLTSDAADDLRSIHAYISLHASRDDADSLLNTLVERIWVLDQFPQRGSRPKELDETGSDDFRQLIVGKYRIFYKIVPMNVRIVLIVDGRRDMQSILNERLVNPRHM